LIGVFLLTPILMRVLLPIALFIATIGSTIWALGVRGGLTLMAILVSHEMGHYLVARKHGVPASLPYFIPMPKFFLLGTLGAVIRMRTDRATRNQLMEIGAAGPIAGFIVAVPAMIAGVMLSEVGPIGPDSAFLGDSILSYAITELLAPVRPPGTDLMADPVLVGAWAGFLVTAINLIPLGQLDGGHVLYAFSPKKSERRMRILYWILIVLGTFGILVHAPWFEALAPLRRFVSVGLLVWAMFGRFTGLRHPPVVDESEPLTKRSRAIAYACAILFALTFMPSPIWTGVESPAESPPSRSSDAEDPARSADAPGSAPSVPPPEH
jgi:membrane-associated protease RseP (regulator of RpoE activity)